MARVRLGKPPVAGQSGSRVPVLVPGARDRFGGSVRAPVGYAVSEIPAETRVGPLAGRRDMERAAMADRARFSETGHSDNPAHVRSGGTGFAGPGDCVGCPPANVRPRWLGRPGGVRGARGASGCALHVVDGPARPGRQLTSVVAAGRRSRTADDTALTVRRSRGCTAVDGYPVTGGRAPRSVGNLSTRVTPGSAGCAGMRSCNIAHSSSRRSRWVGPPAE